MPKPAKSPRRARSLRHGDVSAVKASVKVSVDPKRKSAFDRLLQQMEHARRDETHGFDAYWEAVGAIIDGELYVAGGFESADAFLKKVVKEPKRTAMRMIRVARHASPAEEAKYGTTLLDGALTYIEAQTGGPIRGRLPVNFDAMKIPVERDGATKRLSLAEVTHRDLTAATKKLVRGAAKDRVHASPVERALVAAFAGIAPLREVTVRETQGKVRLGAIPVGAMEKVGRILVEIARKR